MELEQRGSGGTEEYVERLRRMSSRLRETERSLISTKKDVSAFQEMLEQSQVNFETHHYVNILLVESIIMEPLLSLMETTH